MGLPHLGGDEHVAAPEARGAQRLADLALVVVHLGGVDVAVAEAERLLDRARAGAPAQVPGAEPDRGNLRTVRLDVHHGAILPVTTAPSAVPLRRVRRV